MNIERTTVNISKELKKELMIIAKKNHRSFNMQLELAILEHIEKFKTIKKEG